MFGLGGFFLVCYTGHVQIEVKDSLNCGRTEQFVYRELGRPREIRGVLAEEKGQDAPLDVIGVERGGGWVPAQCVKIADSGAGYAYLIFGGEWGIRLKPSWHKAAWDFEDPKQWGEPFKIYGSEKDIIYD
jgi:hypothetical protein